MLSLSYAASEQLALMLQVQRCPPGRGIPLQVDEGFLESMASDVGPSTDELWDRHWCEHHLRRAFEVLRQSHSPRSIEVFDCLLSGQSVGKVAEEFEMSVAAVKKIKQRVRVRLREIVAEQIAEEK